MSNRTKLQISIMAWGMLGVAAGILMGSGNSEFGLAAGLASMPFGFYWGFNT